MRIKTLIEEWETFRRRVEGSESLITELPPSSDDHILKTKNNISGVYLGENNLSQIWAGESRLLLDGAEGKSLLLAKYRSGIRAKIVSLLCDTLTIGDLALNSYHSKTTEQTLLSPAIGFEPSTQLVAGLADPEKGQYNISLGDLIETTSLMESYDEVSELDWSTKVLKRLKNG